MKKILLLLITAILLLASCNRNSSGVGYRYNNPKSDEITIGVSYPVTVVDAETYFIKGVIFAANIVNKNGGVMDKRLNIVIRDDRNNANIAMQIAQTFSDQGITAVIGHWTTNTSYYTEDIYEKNRVVMLTPGATGLILFEQNFDYIFRMIGNNTVFANAIASHMEERNFKKIVIYYTEDAYGIDFAKILERELNARGIIVVDRVTSITPVNIDSILNRWNAFGSDAVIMSTSFPEYIEPIKTIRRAGSMLPVFGGDTLDQYNLNILLDGNINEIYVATLDRNGLDSEFLQGFRQEYGHYPDMHAILGYESVMLLADAIQTVKTTDGSAIAAYLSNLKDYSTVSGNRAYNPETREFDGYNAHVLRFNLIYSD